MRALYRRMQRLIAAFSAILERRRQRQALAHLDDHLLRDIGISSRDARKEIGKLF